MRASDARHVRYCGYEGYNLLHEFVVAFGHLFINSKVNLDLLILNGTSA